MKSNIFPASLPGLWKLFGAIVLLAMLLPATARANQAPVANNDSATTAEDTAVAINVLANDSDPNGNVIRIAINTPILQPPQYGVAVRTSDSIVTYTPAANFFGADSFRYRITDGSLVASAIVTVTVTAVNDPPIAVNDTVSLAANTSIDIVVTANDSDPEGATPTLISSPVLVAPTRGTAARISGSTIRYTPNANQSGSDTFQYEIGDGSGARARAWVNLTIIGGVNRAPIANHDTASTLEDVPVDINVLANDSDPDGDPIALTASPFRSLPLYGNAIRLSATTIRYTPNANRNGDDTLQYEISDGRGGFARAWLAITVTPVNDPPVARDDSASVNRNTAVLINVLANDSDPDGDPLRLAEPTITIQPRNGIASLAGVSSISYKPNYGYSGTDTFRYMITDGTFVASANVMVTVSSFNYPPVAVNDPSLVAESQVFTDFDVLYNDYDTDHDPFALSPQPFLTLPTNGTVTRQSDREVRYRSRAGFVGVDSFTYEIRDGLGRTSSASVQVYVYSITPVASSIEADTISRGAVSRLTVSGENLQGGDVDIATELFVKGQPPRVYPAVKLISVAADGRSLVVDVDATDPAVEGFYNLMIETPEGRTAIAFRVLADALTVDLYTPSEAVAGNVHLLHLVGAGLAGAVVEPLGKGIRVLELDNSDDHHLVGLLYAAADAPPGDQEIRVGTGSESFLLPLRLVNDASEALLPISELRLPGRPAFYLQELKLLASAESLTDRRSANEIAEARAAEEAASCEAGGYQVRHAHSSRLPALADALETGSLPEESPASLEVETWLDLRFRYWSCSGRLSDVTVCFAGGSSWVVPQDGGQSSSFDACGDW